MRGAPPLAHPGRASCPAPTISIAIYRWRHLPACPVIPAKAGISRQPSCAPAAADCLRRLPSHLLQCPLPTRNAAVHAIQAPQAFNPAPSRSPIRTRKPNRNSVGAGQLALPGSKGRALGLIKNQRPRPSRLSPSPPPHRCCAPRSRWVAGSSPALPARVPHRVGLLPGALPWSAAKTHIPAPSRNRPCRDR